LRETLGSLIANSFDGSRPMWVRPVASARVREVPWSSYCNRNIVMTGGYGVPAD
jgi:hypothetical protein